MYTIVDIESTGGKFNEESIIEVAAYKFDGTSIKDQFISLVNPQRDIHPYVEKLTGITSKMVKTAPKFHEIAKRVVEITSDSILVAHNAQFDYRILQLEFKRLGYEFSMKSLCTVILSQELLPDQESYKLGRLSRSLGIPLKDRHRASGDALATVELFKILLEKDIKQNIIKKSIVEFPGESMNSLFKDTIENLNNEVGVFYIYNKHKKLIYIDYSKDIKNKVVKLFTSKKFIPKYVQNNFKSIKVHKTGNISISVIKALNEIRSLKPKINNNIDPKIFHKTEKPDIISKLKDFIITFNGKNENDKSFIFFKNEKFTGYGYFDLFNNINTEQKLNSRLVKVDESNKVKNYVYRLIFQKKYKKLLTLSEIYKFSDIE
ncbi:exonuclease domain-containing protein [Flavobacteriaceae bacterium]|nr:exonuclease domain-containing protein [Flavobacteriaceae bacterium]MDA8704035.1 exonuclease domain-containing protein [Flavobacteriaceae bacterium]MDA9211844.1 exonuclease domain-containing protein [Flavobacteriaceae bacterium]MDA9276563.1 exonuclease domain-containing protein [Flavobacteriaceae bacterium]MDB3874567.1 exonuclease domain-containing protein [Flavobacteriaceae bacterium]|tara:strand:+ start:2235 stop:3362 length:1128 start_codon:yes stop_codon:yes gene_type:complete